MKLGELKGEQAIEVIADLIAPITNIAEDQQNLLHFPATRQGNETHREMAVRDFKTKIPKLLKTHKKDVLDILCAVNGSDPNDLSMLDIIKGIIELMNDKDFLNLFLSAVSQEEQTQPTASSANAEHSKPEQ